MSVWQPTVGVENNRVLSLSRGNPAGWKYKLDKGAPNDGYIEIRNSYGQLLATWQGEVDGQTILFEEEAASADAIPAGSSWQLFCDIDDVIRVLAQGIVVRPEAPFPDAPPKSSEFDGVRYQYSFGTPGRLTDPAWRILSGAPTVYDNSFRSLPNGVAAGSLFGGTLSLFGSAAMLWFAPLRTDAVRLTYNTVRNFENSNGELWVVVCSDYDMSNWAGFYHKQVFGVGGWDNDTLQIVTGSGPTTFTNRATVQGDTANNSYYTAEFNPLTNTYTLWKGTTQVLSWTDQTNVVDHGEGQRYVGFGFRAALLNSGVQVSDWLIGDAP